MTQWGLDTLFNPAKRHMDEEKRRLQSTREEVGDASGGKRVDFETGKVRIRKAEHDEPDEHDDGDPSASPDSAATKPARAKSHAKSHAKTGHAKTGHAKTGDKGEPSAAAIRAAARRGRMI